MRQKTRILIYILIAIAVVIMGSIAILNSRNTEEPPAAQEHLDLGRIYLNDLSYEKAVIEFTEAIEIEPMNADAYLGLADAYVGTGDTDKAAEILEEGYEKTKDERLKERLDEIKPPAETTVVTTVTTEETTTTVSTAALVAVPNLSGLTEEEAISACENAGLNYSVSYGYSDSVEKGYVMAQTIPENTNVAEGISVPFTVSEGVKVVTTVTTAAAITVTTTAETTVTTTAATTVTTTVATTAATTVTTTAAPVEEFITIKDKRYSINLTELDLSGKGLTNDDIKDLDKMVNLKKLNLYFNKISDISVLKKLTNLTSLNLGINQISDIGALEGLANLTYLCLYNNQISDISVLKGLTELTELNLEKNQISDIGALKGLTNLTYLYMRNNQISDVSALKGLTNLTEIFLDVDKIGYDNVQELRKTLPENCRTVQNGKIAPRRKS